MKTNLIVMIVVFQMIAITTQGQQKNYRINKGNVETIKIHGERVFLEEVPAKSDEGTPKVIGAVAAIGGLIADHALTFVNNQIKKNIKKYTGEYAASVTANDPGELTSLRLTRNILPVDGSGSLLPAAIINFNIKKDAEGFYYDILVGEMPISKAKMKSKYYFIDLAFEVEVTYLTKENKKTSIKSKPVYYSLFDMKKGVDSSLPIRSDRFPFGKVSEVSVKVTESNPYKVKLEKVQSFLEDNKDLLTELIGKLKSE